MSNAKAVRCLDNGKEFPSLTMAGIWAGLKARHGNGSTGGPLVGAHIGQAAAGKEPTAGGYRWEFVDPPIKYPVPRSWENYSPPVVSPNDPVYISGRSRYASDHLRKWVVVSKEKDGKVQCCINRGWYPTMLIQVAHIKPFKDCSDEDKYHRDSSLPMSMEMHKLYDFHKFTILPSGKIRVLDRDCWEQLNKLDGQKVLDWKSENARFTRDFFSGIL